MSDAFIISARRTPVAPRNGMFRKMEIADLVTPVIHALLSDAGLRAQDVDDVILGNALYAGGNPARLASLAAGLPLGVPAMTIDTQCCAGLDAIALAASRIRAGDGHVIIAGGVESFSRSPLRTRRPRDDGEMGRPYDRPPFSPWPDRDPDLVEAAAELARTRGYTRAAQELFAMESHAKAIAADHRAELVMLGGLDSDAFKRRLSARICARLPLIAGDNACGLTAATIAVEADAAAMALVISREVLTRLSIGYVLRLHSTRRVGLEPAQPATGAQAAARGLLEMAGRAPAVAEVMESFASQAMAAIHDLGLIAAAVNRGGGALSRGHPIGASGGILAVRLFHEMKSESHGAVGLAAIAAAGGLGSAALFERV
ncbi:MAG: thiolase family protein [Beijerinckiaceae bacterium]|nr:thiolase family protein [Beijerinckiaceae bacterium]